MTVQILDRLYVGNLEDARGASAADYPSVVSITQNSIGWKPFNHLHIPLDDGQPWLLRMQQEIVKFIGAHIEDGVLLHCDIGVSRSSSAAILWLTHCGFSLDEAVQFVSARHPAAAPHPVILESLRMS